MSRKGSGIPRFHLAAVCSQLNIVPVRDLVAISVLVGAAAGGCLAAPFANPGVAENALWRSLQSGVSTRKVRHSPVRATLRPKSPAIYGRRTGRPLSLQLQNRAARTRGMARVRLADLSGPKWTSSGQNGPNMVHFGLANAKIQFGIWAFRPKWSFGPFWTILLSDSTVCTPTYTDRSGSVGRKSLIADTDSLLNSTS